MRQILYAADAPNNLPRAEFDRLFDVPTIQKLRALQRQIDELDATHPGAPPRAMALVDRPDPANVHVFIRGNADNQGPEAPREFLEVVAGPQRKPFEKGSGRLELAEAIASHEQSADRPGPGQPRLAASFRRGAGGDAERFWIALRPAHESTIA